MKGISSNVLITFLALASHGAIAELAAVPVGHDGTNASSRSSDSDHIIQADGSAKDDELIGLSGGFVGDANLAQMASVQAAAALNHDSTNREKLEMVQGTPMVVENLMRDGLAIAEDSGNPFIDNAVTLFKTSVNTVLKKLPPVIDHMKAAVQEEENKKMLAAATTNDALASSRSLRRSLRDITELSQGGGGFSDSSSSFDEDEHQDPSNNNNNNNKKKRKPYRRSNNGDPFSRESHTSPHHHRHQNIKRIQEAMLSGDGEYLGSILRKAHAHSTSVHRDAVRDGHRRAKDTAASDKELMGKQCRLLTKCVKGMSLYDVMIYFYSDDLDPSTGELDDSIIRFDEREVTLKYKEARNLAKVLYDANGNDITKYGNDKGRCEDLLQKFHRNIEHDGVPHWEGATVSQVCYSEGSPTFVALGEIATKISLQTADNVAKELFSCAKGLYNSEARDKGAGEQFVFGKEGAKSTNIEFDKDSLWASSRHPTYPYIGRIIDGKKSTRWATNPKEDSAELVLGTKENKNYRFDDIKIIWKDDARPLTYSIYVSRDKQEWSKIYQSSNDGRDTVGGETFIQGTRINDEKAVIHEIQLTSTITGRYIKMFLKDKITKFHGISIREFTATGTVPQYTYEGKFDTSFVVPSALKLDASARDPFGQLKGVAIPPFEYDDITVHAKLAAFRDLAASLYEWIWNRKISKDQYFKYEYPIKAENRYAQAEEYFRISRRAENVQRLKNYVNGAVNAHTEQIRETFKNVKVKDVKDDIKDADEMKELFLEGYEHIQKGFNFVFGEQASVGFLCGIKEAVEADGANKFPGHCCLDAPYEGDGDNWGREHVCSTECKRPGPFFGGLSEQACSTAGGTWCPGKTDCSVLKQCVNDELNSANQQGKLSYVEYLKPAVIDDAFDAEQCGDARHYFGYDELYTNDDDICDHVTQLSNTKNFKFLEEFFNQGSGGGGGEGSYKSLSPPDRSLSSSDAVQSGEEWKQTLFAMSQAIGIAKDVLEAIVNLACPAEPISGSACAGVKNVVIPVCTIIFSVLNMAYEISMNAYEALTQAPDDAPIISMEETAVIYENMVIMHNQIIENHKKVLEMSEKINELLEAQEQRERSLLQLESSITN